MDTKVHLLCYYILGRKDVAGSQAWRIKHAEKRISKTNFFKKEKDQVWQKLPIDQTAQTRGALI